MSSEELWLASVYRLVILLCGGVFLVMGVVFWLLREAAETEDTLFYWLISGNEPYIVDADKRREHFVFKSTMSLVFGITFVFIGTITADSLLFDFGVLGLGACTFSALFLYLMFVADAVDKNREEEHGKDQAEIEKILLDEEHGRLKD